MLEEPDSDPAEPRAHFWLQQTYIFWDVEFLCDIMGEYNMSLTEAHELAALTGHEHDAGVFK